MGVRSCCLFSGALRIKNFNLKNKSKSKEILAQSTIEYLSSYGIAVFFIVAIIALIFKLGLFSNFSGSSCVSSIGFLCSNPIMNSSGYLSLNIGSTFPINIIAVGCANNTAEPSTFSLLLNNVYLSANHNTTIILKCSLPSNAIGTSFTGTVWIRYNNDSSRKNSTVELGSIVTKITGNFSLQTTKQQYQTPLTVSISPSNEILKMNQILTISANVAGGTPPYTYQWYNDTSGNAVAIPGANSPILKLNALTLPAVFNSLSSMTILQNNTALVVSNQTNKIYTIDIENYILINSINIANIPFSIANMQNSSESFISSYLNNTVLTINNTNFNIIKSIHLKTPGGIFAQSKNYIYTANVSGNTIELINTSSDAILKIITGFNKPINIALQGNYLFVVNSGNDTISIFNITSNSIVYTLTNFFEPRGLALESPSNNYVYIANHKSRNNESGDVSVFNYETNSIVANITGVYQPTGIFFNYNGSYAYILNNTNLFVFNQSSDKIENEVREPNSTFRYYIVVRDSSNTPLTAESIIGSYTVEAS